MSIQPQAWESARPSDTARRTAPCSVDAQLSSERDVKAAFLVNFAIFTEWPAATFADAAEPIVVGVAGDERAPPQRRPHRKGQAVRRSRAEDAECKGRE